MPQQQFWKRLDHPGTDAVWVWDDHQEKRIWGSAVFSEGRAVRSLTYSVRCDASWRTRSARVNGWIGQREVRLRILAPTRRHGWRLNGRPIQNLENCIDLDLNFTPATNTVSLRRLALPIGKEAMVQTAWLRFPSLQLIPLPQRYRRLSTTVYDYACPTIRFKARLQVNRAGLVTAYPPLWEAL